MNEIKEIWSSFDGSSTGKENIPLKILEAQADAITRQRESNEIVASVVTVSGDGLNEVKNILYLSPVYGNGYNYRYIEFSQPLDNYYPVKISAFQNVNTDFGTITFDKGEEGIYKSLENIFKDPRTKIVFTQLKSIGRTIKQI